MSLPVEFIEYARQALGEERSQKLCDTLVSSQQTVAVRMNPAKSSNFAHGERIPWCSNGFYLAQRPVFTLDPLFHSGAYYVQDPSSMYMEMAFEAAGLSAQSLENIRILDLCAAPGGKSTHILSILPDTSLLVSNEVINSRATVLAENMTRWGRNNVVVTNSDAQQFGRLKEWFHVVVVDAPCSGEGMFRKDPKAVEEWSPSNVKLCAERQQRILSDVWDALKPGGTLIYSTCTFNRMENDLNVAFLRDTFNAQVVPLDSVAQRYPQLYLTKEGGIQFIPGYVEGEGQYLAVLKKPLDCSSNSTPDTKSTREKKQDKKQVKGGKVKLPEFLSGMQEGYDVVLKNDLIKFVPSCHVAEIACLEKCVKVILSGRAVANTLGAPDADLAFDINIGLVNLPKVELNKEDALRFLAREPLVFSNEPKGYLLLTYCSLGLGFVKNLGNRSNSLLPVGRRIRMDIR